MWKIITYAIAQSMLLVSGQVFLKIALKKMLPFGWDSKFWISVFLNWQFATCGILFAAASLLWMHIVRNFPLSTAYPMVSLSYVFGMMAAMLVFHEDVSINKWLGTILIVIGCFFIAK